MRGTDSLSIELVQEKDATSKTHANVVVLVGRGVGLRAPSVAFSLVGWRGDGDVTMEISSGR